MSKHTSFSALMHKPHLRVVQSLGYVLTLGTQHAWWGFVQILCELLTPQERASLAFMALKSLDHEDAVLTAETALAEGAGQPIAPLYSDMDEAAFWADMASEGELKAYALASFTRLSQGNQAAFLDYVQGRAAA
ncbi:hypothetical protein LZG00_15845 [Rhodobacteraceae bacterium LMO-12]|nr:hypothetical protein [Rhodobacteraceae bacterium LMO-JJ12]